MGKKKKKKMQLGQRWIRVLLNCHRLGPPDYKTTNKVWELLNVAWWQFHHGDLWYHLGLYCRLANILLSWHLCYVSALKVTAVRFTSCQRSQSPRWTRVSSFLISNHGNNQQHILWGEWDESAEVFRIHLRWTVGRAAIGGTSHLCHGDSNRKTSGIIMISEESDSDEMSREELYKFLMCVYGPVTRAEKAAVICRRRENISGCGCVCESEMERRKQPEFEREIRR